MQRSPSSRKLIIGGFLAAIVALSLFALATVLIPLLQNPGVRTGQLDASQAKPASTSVDGTWAVVRGYAPNQSSVGYTFPEVLPSDRRITSGSTQGVGGSAEIIDGKVVSGEIEVEVHIKRIDLAKVNSIDLHIATLLKEQQPDLYASLQQEAQKNTTK